MSSRTTTDDSRGTSFWAGIFDLAARHPWYGGAAGLVFVALLVPILNVAGGYTGPLGPSIPLFFLVPMLLASTLGGRIPGVVVAIAAVAVWDWFFIPPFYRIMIYYPRDVVPLVVFVCDALLMGQLATVARERAEEATRRARSSETLYDLSVALIGRHDLAAVLPILTQRLREAFSLEGCTVLLREPGSATWRSAAASGSIPHGLNIERSREVTGILSWVASSGQVCLIGEGGDGARPPGHERDRPRAQFWPLHVGSSFVGVLELVYSPDTELDPERDRLLTTLVNGAAIALEQDRLFHEEQEAVLARESDQLKSALLSSVSHDLRTPLAGIKAAASSLLQSDVTWSEEDRRAFAADIDAEADRLARLVSNLLDLSRIEAGAITPNKDWEDVRELVERVVRRLQPRLASHPITIALPYALPPMRLDTLHIEQALTNLIENAAKYSPEGSPVVVTARVEKPSGGSELRLAVSDRGTGISPAEQVRIFEPFYRVATTDRRVRGTGVGLAIVKGLVEADGGRVKVESAPGEGTTFTVILPVEDGDRSSNLAASSLQGQPR